MSESRNKKVGKEPNQCQEKWVTGVFNPNGHHILNILAKYTAVQANKYGKPNAKKYTTTSLFSNSFPISPSFHLHLISSAAGIMVLI